MRNKFQISNFKFQISYKGFTLIELLVALAVIGILVGFATINLLGLRGRARDGERKADLRAIQSALQIYRADQGSYPTQDAYFSINCNSPLTVGPSTYITQLPCDPLDAPATRYPYLTPPSCAVTPPCNTYTLYACLETTSDQDRDADDGSPGDLCSATGRVSHTVRNP